MWGIFFAPGGTSEIDTHVCGKNVQELAEADGKS
jgi:hypothetical protein